MDAIEVTAAIIQAWPPEGTKFLNRMNRYHCVVLAFTGLKKSRNRW